MTSFAQGQPFSSGPVWDQMRFGSEQGAAMPIAGSYMDQLRSFMTSIPSDISKDDRTLYGLLGAQHLGAAETAKQNKETMREFLTYQQQASVRANEMGIKNQIIGSFLNAPLALNLSNRNKYLPEQIAAANATRPIPSYGSANYYGFVR
jgi:hypothetical protein